MVYSGFIYTWPLYLDSASFRNGSICGLHDSLNVNMSTRTGLVLKEMSGDEGDHWFDEVNGLVFPVLESASRVTSPKLGLFLMGPTCQDPVCGANAHREGQCRPPVPSSPWEAEHKKRFQPWCVWWPVRQSVRRSMAGVHTLHIPEQSGCPGRSKPVASGPCPLSNDCRSEPKHNRARLILTLMDAGRCKGSTPWSPRFLLQAVDRFPQWVGSPVLLASRTSTEHGLWRLPSATALLQVGVSAAHWARMLHLAHDRRCLAVIAKGRHDSQPAASIKQIPLALCGPGSSGFSNRIPSETATSMVFKNKGFLVKTHLDFRIFSAITNKGLKTIGRNPTWNPLAEKPRVDAKSKPLLFFVHLGYTWGRSPAKNHIHLISLGFVEHLPSNSNCETPCPLNVPIKSALVLMLQGEKTHDIQSHDKKVCLQIPRNSLRYRSWTTTIRNFETSWRIHPPSLTWKRVILGSFCLR